MYGTPGGLSSFRAETLGAAASATFAGLSSLRNRFNAWRNSMPARSFSSAVRRQRRRRNNSRAVARRGLFGVRRRRGGGSLIRRRSAKRRRTMRKMSRSRTRTRTKSKRRRFRKFRLRRGGRRYGRRRTSRKKSFTKQLNIHNAAVPWDNYEWRASGSATCEAQPNASATADLALGAWLSGVSLTSQPLPNATTGTLVVPWGNHPYHYWQQFVNCSNTYGILNPAISHLGTLDYSTNETITARDVHLKQIDNFLQFRGQRQMYTVKNLGNKGVHIKIWFVKQKKQNGATRFLQAGAAAAEYSQSGNFLEDLNDEMILRYQQQGNSINVTPAGDVPAVNNFFRMWDQDARKFPEMRRRYKMRVRRITLPVDGTYNFRVKFRKPKHLTPFELGNHLKNGWVTALTDDTTDTWATAYDGEATAPPGALRIYFQFIGVKSASSSASTQQVDNGSAHINVSMQHRGHSRYCILKPKRWFRHNFISTSTGTEFNRNWGAAPQVVLNQNMPLSTSLDAVAIPVQVYGTNAGGDPETILSTSNELHTTT